MGRDVLVRRRATVYRLVVVCMAVTGIAGAALAVQAIDGINVDPAIITSGKTALVRVTVRVAPDPDFIAVTLYVCDESGKPLKSIFHMFDDGTHGDKAAGDGVFTMDLIVSKEPAGTHYLRASASYRGQATTVRSAVAPLMIVDPGTPR